MKSFANLTGVVRRHAGCFAVSAALAVLVQEIAVRGQGAGLALPVVGEPPALLHLLTPCQAFNIARHDVSAHQRAQALA